MDGLANVFAGINVVVHADGNAQVPDTMAQQQPQQQLPAAAAMVGDINRLVEAIVASQTRAITAQEHLHELRRYEDRVPVCDGTNLPDFHECWK